jgi:effector-binding domain-containing protein
MPYQCELKQQPAKPTLSIRTRAAVQDLPTLFGKVIGEIMKYLGELGERPAGMPYSAYYNLDMQNLDVEIGFPVAHKLAGKGEIQASEIPGGKLASVMHVGPYDKMGAAYDALTQWVKAQGLETTGVAYELYYTGPETPPQDTRTEILFPITSG